MCLLANARYAKDSHFARQVYNQTMKAFPQSKKMSKIAFDILEDALDLNDYIKKANEIRTELERSGIRKRNSYFQRFQAHDRHHPRSLEIHAESARITNELIQHEYRPDPS